MNSQEYNKRSQIWIEPGMQFKYIFYNVIFLLIFAVVISGSTYLAIWRSVTREFSSVKINEELATVTRMREYEAVRTKQTIEIIPFLKEEANMLSDHQRNALNVILVRTNRKILPLLSGLLIFVVISSLLLSHRIAGPLHRIKRNLNAVSHGDLTASFELRKKDELKDLASEIEHSVVAFAHTISSIQSALDAVKTAKTDEDRLKLVMEIENQIAQYRIQ